jgi:hypothetical protein
MLATSFVLIAVTSGRRNVTPSVFIDIPPSINEKN